MSDAQNPNNSGAPVPPAADATPSYDASAPAAPAYDASASAAPAYNAAPAPDYNAPAYAPAATTPSNKGLSIAALILAIFVPLVGLILGIVAMAQSKKVPEKNGMALAAIIVGAALLVIGAIVTILVLVAAANIGTMSADMIEQLCEQAGAPGTYELTDGSSITCD